MKTLNLAAAALAVQAAPALAQDYPWQPEEPVTIIVPWGAGGATDQVVRVTAGVIEDELGTSVVVTNQPGASGSVGTKNAMQAEHDGLTWASGAPKQLGTYKLLGQFDTFIDEWRLYNSVTNVPLISANPGSDFETMDDVVAAMREDDITIATAGAGSSGHAVAEALASAVDGDYTHVTYDGGNPAVVATVSGEAQVTTQLASEQASMVAGDRLRPLAVLAEQPLEIEGVDPIPPASEFIDAELPILSTAFGIFIPKEGTPDEVIETMDMIWENVIADSEALQTYARENGALFTPSYGEEARDAVWPEIQADAWSFQSAGRTVMSPEELGIPRP